MIENSEPRGSQNVPNRPSTSNQLINHRNVRQYSEITQQTQSFPKKQQAIILSAIEDLTIADYVTSVGNIVGPHHIRFVSRISNNRVCIYLSNEQLVDEFVSEHSIINIKDKQTTVRKLITPARRLIISNVCPTIPHSTISNVLKSIGMKLVSPISFMRAGIPGEQYGHVLSFRRQVYTQPDEAIELPSSLVIKHEETSYRIFLTFDDMSCYICKQQGHLAKNCPSVPQQQEKQDPPIENEVAMLINVDDTTDQTETPPDNNSLIASQSGMPPEQFKTPVVSRPPTPPISMTLPEQRSQKRAAPSLASTTDLSSSAKSPEIQTEQLHPFQTQTTTNPQTQARKLKKMKKSESTESLIDLEVTLRPAISIIENQKTESVVNYQQLVDFFENVHGSSDPISIARQYTTNVQGLVDMLLELREHLEHRSTKARCTRIRKKLEHQLELELKSSSSDDDHDESLISN